jgi:hypothetical protein
MNTNLVEHVDSFVDVWDSQGHNTKHSDVVCAWNLADCMVEPVMAMSEFANSDDDNIMESLVLLGVAEISTIMNVSMDDVFDNTDEFHEFVESMFCCAHSYHHRGWSYTELHASIMESIEGYYN